MGSVFVIKNAIKTLAQNKSVSVIQHAVSGYIIIPVQKLFSSPVFSVGRDGFSGFV